DRDLARDRDYGAVEYAAGDFDAARVLLVEAASAAHVEQSRLKAPLFFGQSAPARGKLKVVDSELIDGGGSLIEKLRNRRRGRNCVERRRRAETVRIRVHPDAGDLLFLAHQDRLQDRKSTR